MGLGLRFRFKMTVTCGQALSMRAVDYVQQQMARSAGPVGIVATGGRCWVRVRVRVGVRVEVRVGVRVRIRVSVKVRARVRFRVRVGVGVMIRARIGVIVRVIIRVRGNVTVVTRR